MYKAHKTARGVGARSEETFVRKKQKKKQKRESARLQKKNVETGRERTFLI